MHQINTDSLRFAFLGAGMLACFFPQRWAPWCDIDLLCQRVARLIFANTSMASHFEDNIWKQSYRKRVPLFKYVLWGLVLILIFPLHTISGSTPLVDQLWAVIDKIRHAMITLSPASGSLFESHDWKLAEYELWEICVFLWVYPIIGKWIHADYVTLAAYAPSDVDTQLRTGQRLAVVIFFLSAIGLIFLVIVQVPTYRIIVELITVFLLALADLYFFWRFLRVGKLDHAVQHLYIFVIVDSGALVAFLVLLIFIYAVNITFRSHWSSAFVAGASAVNLMAANTAALAMRALYNYQSGRAPQMAAVAKVDDNA